jgi:hypothetical protein
MKKEQQGFCSTRIRATPSELLFIEQPHLYVILAFLYYMTMSTTISAVSHQVNSMNRETRTKFSTQYISSFVRETTTLDKKVQFS